MYVLNYMYQWEKNIFEGDVDFIDTSHVATEPRKFMGQVSTCF